MGKMLEYNQSIDSKEWAVIYSYSKKYNNSLFNETINLLLFKLYKNQHLMLRVEENREPRETPWVRL